VADKLSQYGNFASKSLFWFAVMILYFLKTPRLGPQYVKSFRLPCQVQRLEVSVVHVVDRILHYTVHTDHLLQTTTRGPLQAKSTCTRLTASGASET